MYDGYLRTIIQDTSISSKGTLISAKTVAEIFGYVYQYDQNSGKFELTTRGHHIKGNIDQKKAQINQKKVNLTEVPKLINKKVYVPLSFIEETMEIKAKWNGKENQLELEGKYSVDVQREKLMVRTQKGKKAIADIKCYMDQGLEIGSVELYRTENGNEIVTVSQWSKADSGEHTEAAYYINGGVVIDQAEGIVRTNGYDKSYCIVGKNVLLFDGTHIKFYEDATTQFVKELDAKELI